MNTFDLKAIDKLLKAAEQKSVSDLKLRIKRKENKMRLEVERCRPHVEEFFSKWFDDLDDAERKDAWKDLCTMCASLSWE